MVTHATLGGYPLLSSSPVQWAFLEGVQPYDTVFDMTPKMASALMAGLKGPTQLILNTRGNKAVFKNILAVNIVPRDNPKIVGVRCVDRRWYLERMIYLRRFNMRRDVGFRRVGQNPQGTLNPTVPDVWYWPWSLKDGDHTKWQPMDCLVDCLDAIVAFERKTDKNAPGYFITRDIKQTNRMLAVENLMCDDKGHTGLMHVLALFPEAGIYVDENGRYVVYSRISGKEQVALKQLGPEIVGGGHTMMIDNSWQRPSKIEVFFSVEAEVRFDHIGPSDSSQTVPVKNDRSMTNILVLPDYGPISVTENGKTTDYVQHSYVSLDPVLTAWGSPPGVGGPRLTHKLLERIALPFMDLESALLITGVRDPNKDWAGRVGAIKDGWRRLMRLPPEWVSRFLTIKARRVGIIDPVNGTAAKSEVYCDYSFIGTERSFFKDLNANVDLRYSVNVEGYPTGGQVPGDTSPIGAFSLTSTSRAAPVEVHATDPDQGIIRFEFRNDQNNMWGAALPGLVVREDGSPYVPGGNWRNPEQTSPTFDCVANSGQIPKLSGPWKACVILSCVPASPNDERQLFKVTIEPKDIRQLLPLAAQDGLTNSKGPVWQVRIQPGNDGARALIRWLDARAKDTEGLFGVTNTVPNLDGMVLNFDKAQPAGGPQGASLNEIARAVGASIYGRFADHFGGQSTGMLNGSLVMDGFIESMLHSVDSRGVATTTIKMADTPPELDMMSMLDNGTRAILLRQPKADR